jgi:hypothetical protein
MDNRTANAGDLNQFNDSWGAGIRPSRISFGWVLALDILLWLVAAWTYFRLA